MITLTIPEAASALDITEFLVSSLIRLGVIRRGRFQLWDLCRSHNPYPVARGLRLLRSASTILADCLKIRTSSTPMFHLSITSSRLRLNHRSRHAAQRNSAQPS